MTTKPSAAPAKATKTKAPAARPARAGGQVAGKGPTSTGGGSHGAPRRRSVAGSASDHDAIDTVRPLIRVRQIRAFNGRRVTRTELDAITEVARWSGSSRNEQPCRFIALRDRATIRELAELGLPQTRGLHTATAAIAIVMPDEPEREVSRAFDDGRAAERILIAANLLGLAGGISRVRRDVRDPINTLLRVPAKRSVRTIVAIGHPTPEALEPKSRPGHARLPRDRVVFDGAWPPPALPEG
jgi:nitroreductase